MEYFVLKGTDAEGPFGEDELRRALAAGQLTEGDLVRTDESRLWTRLGKVLAEQDAAAEASLPPPADSRGHVAERWRWDRAALVQQVEKSPLAIGLAAIVIACVLALLARWPVLLVLPGIALGVSCGLMLIVRNRPIVGGLLSLAALLLPLALLPSASPAPLPVDPGVLPTSAESGAPPPKPLSTAQPPARSATTVSAPEPVAPTDEAPLAPPLPPPSSLTAVEAPASAAPAASSPVIPPPPSTLLLPTQPEDVIFRIDTGKRRGTGFIAGIGDKVYLFTNHHVLEGAEKVTLRGGVQPPQNLGAIIEIAEDRDLVRVPLAERAALRFATGAQAGEAVVAFGDAGGVPAGMGTTVVAIGPREFEVGAALASGSSGGPVLNASSEVVGITTFSPGIENVVAWIKTGVRPSEPRRIAVRVTKDLRWERMLMSAYQANSARVTDMEAMLTEIVGFAHQLAQKPFRSEIGTRFPQRPDIQGWVEAYNQSARTRMMPNQGKMRDYARRLMGTVRATQAALQNDVRSPRLTPSKGYLKRREDELLKSFSTVNDEIAKVFDVQS